ncbi:protein LDOC1-like [Rhinophrynus dorsalis]
MSIEGTGNPPVQSILARMDSQDQHIDQLFLAMKTLLNRTAHLDHLSRQLVISAETVPAPVVMELTLARVIFASAPLPQWYEGNPVLCRSFLNQVGIYLEMVPHEFPTERSKVGFMISLHSDEALAWANPLWENDKPVIYNFADFMAAFKQEFEVPARCQRLCLGGA